MTISTSVGRKFTVNEIVALAYKTAGLVELSQTPSLAQLSFGRDLLEVIIDNLETENIPGRLTRFELVACVSGTSEYVLDEDILDVLNPAKYIDASETDLEHPSSETFAKVISREEWQSISAREAEGPPSMLYPHRELDAIRLFAWPTPDEAGTLKLLCSRALADVGDGNATVDLGNYWVDYLKQQLASELAESGSMDGAKITRLASKATVALRKAKARAVQGLSGQVVLDHNVEVG